MSEQIFARAPHITASRSGVWVAGVGLLSEADTQRTIGWLSSAIVKHRRRRAEPVPAVVVVDDGLRIDGLGRLDHAAALNLAHAICDALSPGFKPTTHEGEHRDITP